MKRTSLPLQRREFITLLGGAAAWPLAARAQQPAMPVVGYLNNGSPESDAPRLTGLRRGLNETGYVEGRNFLIEYRWAGNQPDQLPALAADLVQLRVAVIVAAGLLPALAAKAATTSIPIVFSAAADPVQLGLVASLNRPGGNLTGFNSFAGELGAKGLALLHDLVPSTETIGFLENPNNPIFDLTTRDVLAAAPVVGLKVQILKASTDREIDTAFVSLVQGRTGALLVGNDPFFNSRIEQLVALAARHAIPAMYPLREFAAAGGLMSYGTSNRDIYQQVGIYTGRILKGAKPADLPVMQTTKFDLVINLKTAKVLNLQIPDKLFSVADEVIE
jgi:putative tryptophan/tyrosine transport system substrate-binding protein